MRKKNSIVIENLIADRAPELTAMQSELDAQTLNRDDLKLNRWGRRFAPSGKHTLVKPLSY